MEPSYGVRKRHEPVEDHTKIFKRTDCDYTDVVISDFDGHSAPEVCQSATSSSPDFVSMKEKLLCDMCTHVLRPLYSEQIVSATLQVENQYLNGINWS
jgi:hypothetical protein